MGRNHEIVDKGLLLDRQGELREPGWARTQLLRYNRAMIKAPKFRIKEWDYYLVMADTFGAAFTVSDDGYVGLQSVSLLKLDNSDGKTPWEHTETILNVLPMGKLKMPSTSAKGDVVYEDRRLRMRFEVLPGKRHIMCSFRNFDGDTDFQCDIMLEQPEMDSMVIATPWPEKHAFYYNQKINTMRASGWMKYGKEEFHFHPDTDFGTLDWGRGVWTYDNTWYWGSGNCDIDGHAFGFNIGYGFGDTSAATENVIFYDGTAHKINDVKFHIPENSYMDPWTFQSSDGRFEMNFIPVLDRAANLDFKVIVSDQHQVFGRMSGCAILDDGTEIRIRDVMCFAEKVHNKY